MTWKEFIKDSGGMYTSAEIKALRFGLCYQKIFLRFLKYADKPLHRNVGSHRSVFSVIHDCITWRDTKEGYHYWSLQNQFLYENSNMYKSSSITRPSIFRRRK